MSKLHPGFKRGGVPQECECCHREYVPQMICENPTPKERKYNWICPWCGYDNAVGGEWYAEMKRRGKRDLG